MHIHTHIHKYTYVVVLSVSAVFRFGTTLALLGFPPSVFAALANTSFQRFRFPIIGVIFSCYEYIYIYIYICIHIHMCRCMYAYIHLHLMMEFVGVRLYT